MNASSFVAFPQPTKNQINVLLTRNRSSLKIATEFVNKMIIYRSLPSPNIKQGRMLPAIFNYAPKIQQNSIPKLVRKDFWMKTDFVDGSHKKLARISTLLSRMTLSEAILESTFNKKKLANSYFLPLLKRAVGNVRQRGMDPELTVLKEIITNRGKKTKEIDYKAKGRFGIMHHPTCRVQIHFVEKDLEIPEKFIERINLSHQKSFKPVLPKMLY